MKEHENKPKRPRSKLRPKQNEKWRNTSTVLCSSTFQGSGNTWTMLPQGKPKRSTAYEHNQRRRSKLHPKQIEHSTVDHKRSGDLNVESKKRSPPRVNKIQRRGTEAGTSNTAHKKEAPKSNTKINRQCDICELSKGLEAWTLVMKASEKQTNRERPTPPI